MGDYEALSTFSDPIWAPPRLPPLPFTNRRRVRKRSFIILAILLVVGFFTLNHYANVADVPVPFLLSDSGKASRPQAQSLEFHYAVPINATAAAQDPRMGDHLDPTYCTTWPVDHEGKYIPQPKLKSRRHQSLYLDTFAPADGWKKPRGLKVVAVVFYGRKRNVDILDCYLQQNLVSNGGYLDDVWFMVHTQQAEDIAWLNEFVKKDPLYKFKSLGSCGEEETYGCIWENMVESDTLYIKIDDDILYIHHDAIPQLVHTRLAQPHPYAISAQLVNSPVTGLQQYHYGAIHPFLPDPSPQPTHNASTTWQPSKLPLYPASAALPVAPLDIQPPYRGHPWLLLTNNTHNTTTLPQTPIGQWSAHPGPDPIAFGPGWRSWAAAAQQLYSLLYNLELNQMHVYHFGRALNYAPRDENDDGAHSYYSSDGHYHRHRHYYYAPALDSSGNGGGGSGKFGGGKNGEGSGNGGVEYTGPGGEQLYDTQYERYNLNFVAIWGRDVALGLPILGDDEAAMTVSIPLRLGRPFVIDTRAVVGHLSFYTQKAGIASTDLMDRWRAFANENVCLAGNQKVPWDAQCEGF
ncbi:uncharacterized protein GGS22DRAFT_104696 [Annulohypoxylon maeteangense]|uniref:uncharacterized protein n=1 Tax=Annulohypoxylon maeteangense TaxID=1927788 RepID=UPI002007EE6C|nr:uncharacterized protein GGS22DRAFT_104696 [Annulohypoxylon maeteangense]KAI0887120.1 hypothetical protein GGS22DRAFT_104696 [Annulohypoxylon maeteangense]